MKDRQYPWNQLNIDATKNKKTIKKAYAVLIKQYKPDENPEKFKEIQTAYKAALLSIFTLKEQVTSLDNELPSDTLNKENEFNSHELDIVEKLLKNLKKMTFSKIKDKNNLNNWSFIERYYDIDNIKSKDKIAKIVFKNVAENNLFLMKAYNRLYLNPKVLRYMNEVFDWATKWQDYRLYFPEEYFIVTLDYIENEKDIGYFILVENFLEKACLNIDKGSQQILNIIEVPAKRFWSFVLDLVIALFVLRFIDSINMVSNHSGSFYILIFFVIRYIFESLTINQTSIGKIILRLKIIDEGSRSFFNNKIFVRHIVLFVFFVPLICIFTDNSAHENICLLITGIIVIINFVLLFTHKKLLHDLISKTSIVNSK